MNDNALLRTVAERNTPPRNQLQRLDWLRAALQVFVAEGIDEVRITRLANDLAVTRGSFYWHFNNRDELIDALVEYWRQKNTHAIVAAMTSATSLSEGILAFFELCIDNTQFDPRLDLAIREWARRSDTIRSAVDAADNTRIQALCDFFTGFDYSMPQALIRARVMYFSQIGFYALDVKESLHSRVKFTEAYFEIFTGQTLSRSEFEHFRHDILKKYGGTQP